MLLFFGVFGFLDLLSAGRVFWESSYLLFEALSRISVSKDIVEYIVIRG